MNYAFRTFFKESLETVADVVKAVAVFTIVTDHFYGFTICVGPSMLPTINLSGEVLLFDIMSYKALNKHYQPGDVVICTCPYDRNRSKIKLN